MASSIWRRFLDTLATREIAKLDDAGIERTPTIVVPLDSHELLQPIPRVLSVAIAKTGEVQPLSPDRFRVRSATMVAGPRTDGLTPNAGYVYIGGPEVTAAIGIGLLPGNAPLIVGPTDLSDWYILGIAGDVVRLLVEI